jgi:hypothetical protein
MHWLLSTSWWPNKLCGLPPIWCGLVDIDQPTLSVLDPGWFLTVGIAVAKTSVREDFLYPDQVFRGQHQIGSTDVFGNALGLARTWDWNDVVALSQQPGERQLRYSSPFEVASSFNWRTAPTFFSKLPGCQRGSVRRMSLSHIRRQAWRRP